eukprot:CAMPEP_0170490432 /NCGR_PEP_ID=MMETSP0208-20121228/8619_1 /TAXON_ID=197538 /ORGANISM="Strombidium inclinatum, Strain S3" /LENGTH=30 /DNA_ID= /DNA_START= /DNA_END= /DNA_ORIENTATION=
MTLTNRNDTIFSKRRMEAYNEDKMREVSQI